MKKAMSIFVTISLLVMALIVPSSAANQEVKRETEEYGDIRIETIFTVYDSFARSSAKTGEKTKNYYFGNDLIATVKFKVTFGYDGSSAWVNSTNVTKSTYGGWSYSNQSIRKNSNTATLSAELSKFPYEVNLVAITMTCSPTGAIS